jgi:TonB-linked SusC/RagA family outer membrane protein
MLTIAHKNKPALWFLKFPVFICLLLIAQNIFAQGNIVTGKINGPGSEPISGVSVLVKGTTKGTSTDNNGNFSLSVPNANATLVISSLGYERTEINLEGRSSVTITLATATQQLDQVVVVGYGTTRKRDITGSVASIKGSELAKQPVQTATQALQGKVAGVQIVTSGDPNALPTVRIRGTGTTLGGQNPLYVVDGVITEDIRNINTADITSLDVLKDASATAIYGMRAANGVLIITTKKGRVGKMLINYDGNAGIREVSHLVNLAGPKQYAGYLNEASIFYGNGNPIIDTTKLTNSTDWFDVILRRAFEQNHNVSISGGSDKINYFLSAGYLSDEGIVVNNKLQRFTLRSNNEYKINNKLKLSTLISYSRTNLNDVDLGSAYNNAYRAAPYVASKINGKYGNTSLAGNVGNPLLNIEKNYIRGLENRLQGTGSVDYKPISWLTLRSSIGVDLSFYKNTTYGYKFSNSGPDNVFIEPGGNQQRTNSQLTLTSNDATRWIWDNTATAAKTFGAHSISLLVGVTSEEIKFNSITGSRRDVPENKDQWYLAAGNSTVGATNNSTGDKSTRNSYISRLNYAYNDRYLLTATFRADGTSRFASNNRWGYFPSVGAGWNISKESFMQNQKVFNNLKLRGSWGRVGNDQISSSLFIPVAAINLPYFINGQPILGTAFQDIVDPNIKWEVTEEYDLGLDFSLLQNRLSGEVDYYDKKTKDALVEINVPGILGDPNSKSVTNAATISNKGVELGLNWRDKINKDWSYNLSGNIAWNTNKIINLNGGQALISGGIGGNQGFTTKTDNGQPIGSFYVLQTNGLFQTDAEATSAPKVYGNSSRAGDLRYIDVNKDNSIDDKDRVYLGSYQPKITYGINGGVTFRVFDLSFGGYGTSGSKIYNGKKALRADARDNIETSVAQNRWTVNNTNTNVPHASLNQLPASDYFIESGNFFRINNLTLGYTLPASLLSKAKLNSLRIYVTSQNLVTITNYTGFTPEIQRGVLDAGIELNAYPTTRTFAVGINLGF